MFSASKSVSSFESDPYWENTVLLLNGASASNGMQNNTIIDSAYNRVVTSNGTPIQGSVSPYGNLWSNYFSGSGQYISVPDNVGFSLSSGDFTIESYIYLTAYASIDSDGFYRSSLISQDQFAPVTSRGWLSYLQGTASSFTTINFTGWSAGSATSVAGSYSFALNTWYHIAIVRSANRLYFYVNGELLNAGGTAFAVTIDDSSIAPKIGAAVIHNSLNFNWYFPGHISNLRVVKGTAVYTANFKPSTTPLTAVSGTSLLTCQSNRFIDNSSNNFAITTTGTPSVSKFSPVMDTVPITSGSTYLNGSSDYLSLASDYDGTNGISFTPGSTDYTIEFWVYPTSTANAILFSTGYGTSGRVVISLSSMTVNCTIWTGSSSSQGGNTTATLPLNAWSHVAVGRSSNLYLPIYINGVRDKRFTLSFPTMTQGTLGIGAHSDGTGTKFAGYITDVRYSANAWVYTDPVAESSFPLPTSPLTKVSTTTALLNMTNAGIVDQTDLNNLRTVGDAQVSTVVKKYGNGSMYFDGNGDYLTFYPGENFNFGTANFTIEFWMYATAITSQMNILATGGAFGTGASRIGKDFSFGMALYTRTSVDNVIVSEGSNTFISGATNQWIHYAIVRNGNTFTLFRNGTSVSTNTFTGAISFLLNGSTVISTDWDNDYFTGYLDDLRVTKGVARYTQNFTVPHRALPVMPNTRDNIPSYIAVKQYDYAVQANATAKVKLLSDKRPIAAISNTSATKIGFQVFNQNGTLSGPSYMVSPIGTLSGSLDIDENDNVYIGTGSLLLKCNLSGTVAWAVTGFPTTHYISDVSYKAGKLAVSMRTDNSTYWADSYIMYINASDGSSVWSRKITAPSMRCQFGYSGMDQDANPFIGGLWGYYYASLVKFDTSGNLLWNKHFGFDSTGVWVNPNTGCSIVASYNPAQVRVYDRSGNVLAGISYTPTGSPFITPMVFLDDDNTFVVGGAEPANPTNAYSLFLIRHGADGSVLWKKAYAGSNLANTGDISAYRIASNQNGDIIVTGTASSDAIFMTVNKDTGEIISSSSTWLTVGTNVQLSINTSLTAQTVTVASFTPSLSSTTATFSQSTGSLTRTS